MFYLPIILASLYILSRRRLDWGWLIAKNWPILIFYAFLLISVTWANSPFASFKRWFKESGNIVVALVILSEANPQQAFRAVFVRCALVLIPLSMILLRWFPTIGRGYNIHSGAMEAVGVTHQKNALGTMILVCGLIFFWDWLERTKNGEARRSMIDRLVAVGVGVTAVWLLYLCDSKTSIVALTIGAFILTAIRLPLLHRRVSAFGTYALFVAAAFFLVDQQIGISETIIRSLGRDMTFTGRTEVWRELLNVGTDRLLGTGFMSFWDDMSYQSRLPNWVAFSAHNGYLEIFLAGGYFGVTMLALMLLGTAAKINRHLRGGTDYSVVRFAIFVMALIANFSESNFACMTPLGILFLLAAIGEARPDFPHQGFVLTASDHYPISTDVPAEQRANLGMQSS
jgi:O-antigen ligase